MGRKLRVLAASAILSAGLGCTMPTAAPGSIQLPPGYIHQREQGIDSEYGRIWKFGGPVAVYEIGGYKCNLVECLPDIESVEVRSVAGYDFTVVRQKHGRVGIMFQDANFEVEYVRTEGDFNEVRQMVLTYWSDRWHPKPKQQKGQVVLPK